MAFLGTQLPSTKVSELSKPGGEPRSPHDVGCGSRSCEGGGAAVASVTFRLLWARVLLGGPAFIGSTAGSPGPGRKAARLPL